MRYRSAHLVSCGGAFFYYKPQITQIKQIINNKHNTNMNNKEQYTPPVMTLVEIGTSQILAGSFTGNAPDSDDSEFGGAPERRGTWGNLWETEN